MWDETLAQCWDTYSAWQIPRLVRHCTGLRHKALVIWTDNGYDQTMINSGLPHELWWYVVNHWVHYVSQQDTYSVVSYSTIGWIHEWVRESVWLCDRFSSGDSRGSNSSSTSTTSSISRSSSSSIILVLVNFHYTYCFRSASNFLKTMTTTNTSVYYEFINVFYFLFCF